MLCPFPPLPRPLHLHLHLHLLSLLSHLAILSVPGLELEVQRTPKASWKAMLAAELEGKSSDSPVGPAPRMLPPSIIPAPASVGGAVGARDPSRDGVTEIAAGATFSINSAASIRRLSPVGEEVFLPDQAAGTIQQIYTVGDPDVFAIVDRSSDSQRYETTVAQHTSPNTTAVDSANVRDGSPVGFKHGESTHIRRPSPLSTSKATAPPRGVKDEAPDPTEGVAVSPTHQDIDELAIPPFHSPDDATPRPSWPPSSAAKRSMKPPGRTQSMIGPIGGEGGVGDDPVTSPLDSSTHLVSKLRRVVSELDLPKGELMPTQGEVEVFTVDKEPDGHYGFTVGGEYLAFARLRRRCVIPMQGIARTLWPRPRSGIPKRLAFVWYCIHPRLRCIVFMAGFAFGSPCCCFRPSRCQTCCFLFPFVRCYAVTMVALGES